MTDEPRYHRILLKLSGEAFSGPLERGLDNDTIHQIAMAVREVYRLGVQICIVIGAGNIFRGGEHALKGLDRPTGDDMGMLATLINGLALHRVLQCYNVKAQVMSAIDVPKLGEPFVRRRAVAYLEQSEVVICTAGTGNPFFTTDTAAALRAAELHCDVILKATQVDGVYDSDPHTRPDARRYHRISYQRVLTRDLGIMDGAAIALARKADIPIVVFSLSEPQALRDAVMGKGRFTVISSDEGEDP